MPPQTSAEGPSAEPRRPTVLVVDDDPDIRLALEMILKYEDFEVWTAKDARDALGRLDEEQASGRRADVVLSDVKMPGMDGLELLAELRSRPGAPQVVMISGHADIATAVEAVRKGAADFLEKPLEQNRVVVSLRSAMRQGRLTRENAGLRRALGDQWDLVGESATWRAVVDQVKRLAAVDAPVLLTGENGTGKEVVARNLHLLGPRSDGPFVPVNCAAIPSELIESELFGHEKGSFTGAHERRVGHFEAADGGTLFLDEIGDMPLAAQATVLRALETHEVTRVGGSSPKRVNIRVVAATNADLAQAVEDGRFRMDLFYRLNVVPLRLPPLRERPDDVAVLAHSFLERQARRLGRAALTLDEDARALLRTLDFPGNVRQLKNLLDGASVFAEGDRLTRADIEGVLANGPGLAAPRTSTTTVTADGEDPFDAPTFEEFKNLSEAAFFRRKLVENEGNVKRTAENLGMQRSHLYKKLDRYGLKD
ncbi:sigma-54-dependent transcriptional regulator [Engelhardtia mirabilis]|uniref:Nitrogen regulation protein NR(I) n=1 Tax=Engelhardtia mirabilis TaxID=2528011 RepID=A0A518BNP8_9BACT|nr:Nitrogen regulation protein NR(I) [Planctomycetes bacterium Pla133]QDV02924.1 Nitrogen regulation protein NR(I) [Planctomycetes bacterium Pla86]